MKFRTFVIFFIFISISTFAQEIRKYNNDFLTLGVGAKSLSLGGSTAATISDVTSVFWNPAGLLFSEKQMELGLMHAEQFAGLLKFDYFGINYKLDTMSNVAFSVVRAGVDNIQNSLDLFDKDGNFDYNRIKNFSVADYAFLFSYARKTKVEGLNLGANFKIIYRNEGEFANALGFGLDAALQYRKKNWYFGAMANDVSTTFNFWKLNEDALKVTFETDSTLNTLTENTIDITMPSLSLGVARDFIFSENLEANLEIDAKIYFDGQQNALISGKTFTFAPSIGTEFAYKKFIFFRIGFGNFQKIQDFDKIVTRFQPNLGLGIEYKSFTLDYALTDIGSLLVSYSNVFSLKYRFNINSHK